MLYIADEVFFTGTAAEITPIRSIDRLQVGKNSRDWVSEMLRNEVFGILSGGKEYVTVNFNISKPSIFK